MSEAGGLALGIVGYLTLFAFAGVAFLFINLVIGRLLRPDNPHEEKLEIYECGEPTIGSSFVQFDLRFYVVALLFIIFDVEVALFFPWAIVFGKAAHLVNENRPTVVRQAGQLELAPHARGILEELGVPNPTASQIAGAINRGGTTGNQTGADAQAMDTYLRQSLRYLAWITVGDILAFFGVLMVGFLYVWRRGDLNWVRATVHQQPTLIEEEPFATGAAAPRAAQLVG